MSELIRFDFRDHCKGVDSAIAATNNPHHRAILLNYRRHGLLEISGRWEEILSPTMTVEHPYYRIMYHNRSEIYDGMDSVREMYRSFSGISPDAYHYFVGPIDEKVAVADWGLASESKFDSFLPGRELIKIGYAGEIDDADALYQARVPVALVWPYAQDARLIGENVYQDWGSARIRKATTSDLYTHQEVVDLVAPLLEDPRYALSPSSSGNR